MTTPYEQREFKDPTFTPLRDEAGGFTKVPPPPTQVKINHFDPDWERINPDIIALCQRNGMARGCMTEYLVGHLTWLEALETMVVALGKELVANQIVLVDQRNEYLSVAKQLQSASVAQTLALDEESLHESFFGKQ